MLSETKLLLAERRWGRQREAWGFSYFFIVSLLSLWKLLSSASCGHYDFFQASALKIWSGQNPYAISYPAGFFLYSPSCALFFYGLFAFLPYWIGLAAYMIFSWLIFVKGARAFLNAFQLGLESRNYFWFLISAEVIGTLLNARIEIFVTGIVLLAGSWLAQGRRSFWAYFLLAMVCNFKMQSYPTVGLLLIVSVLSFRRWKAPLYFAFAVAFWYLLPFAVKPAPFIRDSYHLWTSFMGPYVKEGWLTFQQLFTFTYSTFGWAVSFESGQIFAASVGVFFALALTARIWVDQRRDPDSVDGYRLELLRALGLGSAFILLFSPMGQSASFTLYAPLLGAALYLRERRILWNRGAWSFWIATAFVFISLFYSDLTPLPLREFFFNHAVKIVGVGILGAALCLETLSGLRGLRHQNES